MSMPSFALRVSFRIHFCAPVLASSANAESSVAPNTVLLSMVTPFGPMSAELYFLVHRTLPVWRLMASTFEAMFWVERTLDAATGVVAYAPNAPVGVIDTVHAPPSRATLEALIGLPT